MEKKSQPSASFTWNGKVITKRAKTKEKARRKADMELFMLQHGFASSAAKTMTVKAWSEEWLPFYKKDTVSAATYRDYQSRLDGYVLPEIGFLPLDQVRAIDILRILKTMQQDGLSDDRISKVSSLIVQMFNDAVPNGLIMAAQNPVLGMKRPEGKKAPKRRPATDQERRWLLDYDYKRKLWVRFLMFTGARPGESSNLTFKDIFLDDGVIYLNGTKNANAKRFVPAPRSLMLDLLSTQGKRMPGAYVFPGGDGIRKNTSNDRQWWWRSVDREINIQMGCKMYRNVLLDPRPFPSDLVPYCLRHAWFTDLAYSGMPEATMKMIMGHSLGGVSDVYAHSKKDGAAAAGEYIISYYVAKNMLPESDLIFDDRQKRGITREHERALSVN